MVKKDTKVIRVRNTIIAFVTIIAIMILGFGTYVSTDLADPSDAVEGEDYTLVAEPRPRRPGAPIQVIEFFSYGCVHCKNFDPLVEEWAANQPEDVTFKRMPAMWSPIQTLLGQTYVTLESADVLADNHMRLFRAIHDARRQFLTPEMVADYVDGRGLSREDFLREFKSPAVRAGMRAADRSQREFQVRATPSLVVGGEFVVGMRGGQAHALKVVDLLLERIRIEDARPSNPGAPR